MGLVWAYPESPPTPGEEWCWSAVFPDMTTVTFIVAADFYNTEEYDDAGFGAVRERAAKSGGIINLASCACVRISPLPKTYGFPR